MLHRTYSAMSSCEKETGFSNRPGFLISRGERGIGSVSGIHPRNASDGRGVRCFGMNDYRWKIRSGVVGGTHQASALSTARSNSSGFMGFSSTAFTGSHAGSGASFVARFLVFLIPVSMMMGTSRVAGSSWSLRDVPFLPEKYGGCFDHVGIVVDDEYPCHLLFLSINGEFNDECVSFFPRFAGDGTAMATDDFAAQKESEPGSMDTLDFRSLNEPRKPFKKLRALM